MKTTTRLLAIAIVAVVAVMFTIGNVSAEEPQSCKDLKDKVCKICGEESDGCKAIKKETDTEENGTTAIFLFDERDMLVSCGVKHKLRTMARKNPSHRRKITYVSQFGVQTHPGKRAHQLLFDPVQIELAVVVDDQGVRLEPSDLPAELGSDRAAATGNKNRLSFDGTQYPFPIQGYRLAAKEILDENLTQLADDRSPPPTKSW